MYQTVTSREGEDLRFPILGLSIALCLPPIDGDVAIRDSLQMDQDAGKLLTF
jgi:hypothetical protein